MAGTSTVAVLGTGIMGAPMARHIARAGLDVRVWNRTRERAEPLAGDGAVVAATPAAAVADADLVITMLADAASVRAVMEQAIGHLCAGAVWVQCSTVGAGATERLAAMAFEAGVAFVDAPVLGTRRPAEEGALVVLASGPEEARERCAPVFDAIGSRTMWLGEAGAGSRMKLVANLWVVGMVETLAETVALALALGVGPERFLEAISGGPLDCPYAHIKARMMLDGEFAPSFPLELARKDAGLILEAATARGLDLAVAGAAARQLDAAVALGHGRDDVAAVVVASAPSR